MPKLLLLAPCDNVLLNKGIESASLIVIMTQVVFPAPPADLDKNVFIPLRWYIFVQWEVLPEEWGIRFIQSLYMQSETAERHLESEQAFTTEQGKTHHRIIQGSPGFPVVPPGKYRIVVSLKKRDDLTTVEMGSYPLLVVHEDNSALAW